MATEEARPALGGREVDANNVNSGLLRCPRCNSRLVSRCGELVEREGPDAVLWVPHNKPTDSADAAVALPAEESAGAISEAAVATPDDGGYDWTQQPYASWWRVGGMDDVDNLGLSRMVPSPGGPRKLAMCVECNYGPVGHQLGDDACIWLACDLLHQQAAEAADDAADFRLPDGVDVSMIQNLIASGMATVQYHVTFDAQRLGMCLADAPDPSGGVVVLAFTEMDGALGPAEESGKVAVGDRIARVNGRSTSGLDYAAVLDLIVEAPRPITLHFERRATQGGAGGAPPAAESRIHHEEWRGAADAAAEPVQ